jgi:hypothetical protein
MELLEGDRVAENLIKAFDVGYPHLSLEIVRRQGVRPVGVWRAIIRVKDGGRLLSSAIRRHRSIAIGAALAAVPEGFRVPGRIRPVAFASHVP